MKSLLISVFNDVGFGEYYLIILLIGLIHNPSITITQFAPFANGRATKNHYSKLK